jgi:hypothetical protein
VGASELSNICFEIDAAYKASDPIPANMIKKLEREISIIQLSLESFNSEDLKHPGKVRNYSPTSPQIRT